MCCSRDHYPATVGIHEQSPDKHTHLVLPWHKLNHVVCVTNTNTQQFAVTWRDFNGWKYPVASGTFTAQEKEIITVRDLVIVAMAESGKVGNDYFRELVGRFNKDRESRVTYSGDGLLEFKPPPPEEIEEWHEWLVKVATSERDDYQRMLVMEKALHTAHPELDV